MDGEREKERKMVSRSFSKKTSFVVRVRFIRQHTTKTGATTSNISRSRLEPAKRTTLPCYTDCSSVAFDGDKDNYRVQRVCDCCPNHVSGTDGVLSALACRDRLKVVP